MEDAEIRAAVSILERSAGSGDLAPDTVRAVVTAATRLYALESDRAGEAATPLASDLTATEALTLACALLRSQDLTPFDMAVWFARKPHV